ncbi:MAG TPA: methylamine dehydrogenase accessory protein MauD [Methylophaga aminisulfidivorans]|jgi:methylamine dehydrogenase accessory protein MauD|uniref:methylamine dehydrogenase accessory protein MauD n=1 Tax=Methylophaga TaxID=40222 RepID=UPI001767DB8B|nr:MULTISPECIES: methylamine dehydrogenase accessory protein MauD [Methylophaga]HIC45255.1 methylamine dehydrogenase accessory protein MauD [Methylophaga sp.]HIM39846.1 methylamine dehydrogenase accessory protein MauD [Methylophaga aminisulfidivorans]
MINTLIFLVAVLSIIVIMLTIMVFAMTRQIGILFERISPVGAMINDSGPEIGSASPSFDLTSLNGGDVKIGYKGDKSTLVFFLSPTCPICNKLLPAIKSIQSSEARSLNVILASDGDATKHREFIQKHDITNFPYVLSQPLGTTYRVSRLPFAVLLNKDGVVLAKGLVNTREQLDSLFNAAETGYASIQDLAKQNTIN